MLKFGISLLTMAVLLNASGITRQNFIYADYPDMKNPHSSWGGLCYVPSLNKVVVSVTDHISQVGIFEWDCATKTMMRRTWMTEGAHLRDYEWQGKIHSQMVENKKDGWLYWGTDGGNNSEEYLMDHPNGYGGGYFMKYNPKTFEIVNMGQARKYESVKEVALDQNRQRLYGFTYPSNHFVIKDLKTDLMIDKGSINKAYTARIAFSDDWGNVYYTDMRGYIIKYEPASDSLLWAPERLARDSGTESYLLRSGLTGWARKGNTNEYYMMSAWNRLFKLQVQEKGIGPITDLGSILEPTTELSKKTIHGLHCPNLVCHSNNKLYYWIGGHGGGVKKDQSTLVSMDLKTHKKEIVKEFSWDEIAEVTGCQIMDEKGNIYFAARRHVEGNGAGESGSSVARFVVFNPEKEINP